MTSENKEHNRLQVLSDSDFEVVDGQSDIRNWDVRDTQGRRIGKVDDLIVDAQRKKVRYMVVDLNDNELNLGTDHEVLIPIGMAELHEKEDDVIVPNISAAQLSALPRYDRDQLNEETERTICAALGRTTNAPNTVQGDDFYQHEHFNDTRFNQRRLPASTTYVNQETDQGSGFHLRHRSILGDTGSMENSQSTQSTTGESITGFNRTRNHESSRVEDEAAVPVNNQHSRDTNIDRLMDQDGSIGANDEDVSTRRSSDDDITRGTL
jgi:sporulation protein YlmC with PRC-barrel domain